MSAPDLRTAFKQAGFKLTRHRLKVVDTILEARGAVTSSEILQQVRRIFPTISISTVSGTISVMKELGLLTEISTGNGEPTYEPIVITRHDRLVCRTCNLTVSVGRNAFEAITERLRHEYGFRLESDLIIFGECSRCQEKRVFSDRPLSISV